MVKELGDKLLECGVIKFGDFDLVHGGQSKYYVDVKRAATKPDILQIISQYIIDLIYDNDIRADYIACVEVGGIPIGVMTSVRTGLDLLIIRKEENDHGLKNRIIGDYEKKGVALLVEDVTATGGSVMSAVQTMRSEGLIVKDVITVVDRDEGAEEVLTKEGLNLRYLVNAKTLIRDNNLVQT